MEKSGRLGSEILESWNYFIIKTSYFNIKQGILLNKERKKGMDFKL